MENEKPVDGLTFNHEGGGREGKRRVATLTPILIGYRLPRLNGRNHLLRGHLSLDTILTR